MPYPFIRRSAGTNYILVDTAKLNALATKYKSFRAIALDAYYMLVWFDDKDHALYQTEVSQVIAQ